MGVQAFYIGGGGGGGSSSDGGSIITTTHEHEELAAPAPSLPPSTLLAAAAAPPPSLSNSSVSSDGAGCAKLPDCKKCWQLAALLSKQAAKIAEQHKAIGERAPPLHPHSLTAAKCTPSTNQRPPSERAGPQSRTACHMPASLAMHLDSRTRHRACGACTKINM